MKVTVEQITTDYNAVSETVKTLTSDEQLEIVQALSSENLSEYDSSKLENVKQFISSVSEENRLTFVTNVVDSMSNHTQEIKTFMKDNYLSELTAIMESTAN